MITIDEIARLANVSKSTVSKALNDRHDVSPATKTKILKIAQQYHFTPNVFGKSLKSKITKNIGVIFTREKQPLSNNPFFSRILEGIEAELAINNYNLVLNILPDNSEGELPRMIRERYVDGLLLIGVFHDQFVDQLSSHHLPVVQIDPKQNRPEFSQVFIDNEHGAHVATQYLIDAGHRKIGFISGELSRLSFKQRLDGYKKTLAHNGIAIDDNLIKAYGIEEGYEQVSTLIDQEHPTALFCTNDINAMHGYKAIHDMKLRIPDDISFIGFDDIWSAAVAAPPLTTVRVYKEELGSIGVRRLLEMINSTSAQPSNTIVPVKLIVRQSVRMLQNKEDMDRSKSILNQGNFESIV